MHDDQQIEISSREYWFKVIEMLQQNWALIDKDAESDAWTVFFINDASGVFDRVRFPTVEAATRALQRNGFADFAKDKEAQKFIAPPSPPYYEAQHPNGPIYSSGRYWS